MYFLVLSKIQRSLAYVLEAVKPIVRKSLEPKRNSFLVLFSLYRSLESFIITLEKAFAELESLEKGGVVVRKVIESKLDRVRLSVESLGSNICSSLPHSAGVFNIIEADKSESEFHKLGLYRLYIAKPIDGQAKSPGMGHCYKEICPYVAISDGKVSYEIAYTATEPLLSVDKLYDGIDYKSVPYMQSHEHIAQSISKNIERQLQPAIEKIDMREAAKLSALLQDNKSYLSIMKQRKNELSKLIRSSFTIKSLLCCT